MVEKLVPSRGGPSSKRRKLIATVLLGSAAAFALGAAVTLNWQSSSIAVANPDDPEQVAVGRAVYQQNCASCHGANLEGQPEWRVRKSDGKLPAPPHDETGHTWHHPDKQLFKITKSGFAEFAPGYESDMPTYESVLTDEEIWAALSYIKSTWSTEIRQRQDRRSQRANQ